jgi:tetratricopeptide (TPR) repeat protein
MPAEEPPESGGDTRHVNRLDSEGGTGDVVQARDVHGGVHFHQQPESFDVTPRQLPGPAHGFVNRDSELAYLAEVVTGGGDESLVIVITGTAGVGKTSLALRWAHSVHDRFPGGQLYANLRGYDPGQPLTAEQILGRFLRDLGVPARAVPTTLDDRASLYRSILADRQLLIVLDNAATVGQVRPLLPGTPSCLVVVTSRSRLSGLVAREGAHRLRMDLLGEEDAVALLRAATEGHRLEDRYADLVELAGLCARLPLALRIAAERAASRPLMLLTELIADLRDESGLWEALSVNGDEEADAVRTVFAWSYRALPEPAAAMFRLLGLHPGSAFSLPAAAALAGVSITQARRDLDALVGAHLVEHSGPSRYQVHDLLRAYAIDQVRQLETDEARAGARRRILAWYLHTADAARRLISPFDPYHFGEPVPADVIPLSFGGYEPALRWYQIESANLVAAVQTAADTGEHAVAWQLALVLGGIYTHQNAFDDWITTGQIGAESATSLGDRAAEASALHNLGKVYFQSRRLDDADACHRRALAIRRERGDRFGEALSVNALGLLGLRHRRLGEATARLKDGMRIFAELGEHRWEAILRCNLAEALCERGEFGGGDQLLRDALPVFRDLGDRFGEGNGLFLVAWTRRGARRLDEARAAIENAIGIALGNDNDAWLAHWLTERARIQLAQGSAAGALTDSQRAAVIQRQLGDRSREAIAFDVAGQAYQRLDRHDEATKFHRRAVSVHRDLRDLWHLAGALEHLAAALDQMGEHDEAQQRRQEAVSLLAEFDDPPAVALRQRLTRTLASP